MSQGKNAAVFITGAAGGIGAATTRSLVDAGIPVFAGYHRDTGALPESPLVTPVQLDVTDPGSVARAARLVADATGERGLRALVNNAGIIIQGPLELLPPESLRRQLDVNTLGPAFVVQQFVPLLRRSQGRIINISAPMARVPVPFMSAIGASKAALSSWSTALRGELAPWRIPVVVIEPDGTRTAIFAIAERQAEADLARATPEQVALYREQLDAVATAAASLSLGSTDPVARVILKAVLSNRPRRHYTAGRGAKVFAILSHLPAGVRDRVVVRSLGLHKVAAGRVPTSAVAHGRP